MEKARELEDKYAEYENSDDAAAAQKIKLERRKHPVNLSAHVLSAQLDLNDNILLGIYLILFILSIFFDFI